MFELIQPEERTKILVSSKTLRTFVSLSGGWLTLIFIILLGIVQESFPMINFIIIIRNFGQKSPNEGQNFSQTLILMVNGIAGPLLTGLANHLIGQINYRLCSQLTSKMFFSLLHSRLEEFISRVPSPRLMVRFSTDLHLVYRFFLFKLSPLHYKLSAVMVQLIVYIYFLGIWILVVICLMVVACYFLHRNGTQANQEVLRLTQIANNQKTSRLLDTFQGLPNIRSAKMEVWSRERFQSGVDGWLKNEIVCSGLAYSFSMHSCLVVCLLVVLNSYLLLVFVKTDMTLYESVIIVLVGSMLGKDFKEAITEYTTGKIESIFTGVERCNAIVQIKPEAQYKRYKKDMEMLDGTKESIDAIIDGQKKETEAIVSEGRIELRDMSCKYLTRETPVLEKISFEVRPGEKVGVVGRTGSGKSTLLKVFLRALDYYEGEVRIDGKNIKSVDLKSLRSQISVVTQETSLIEGTLRENLKMREDAQIEEMRMMECLAELGFDSNPVYRKSGLEMQIDCEGANLSAGEKQIVCYCRTLLENNRIILLDEATANIDIKTEEIIQRSIEKDFKQNTMIIISHRIHTIMKCDRILIIEKGRVAAFDSPRNLLDNPYFAGIIKNVTESKK